MSERAKRTTRVLRLRQVLQLIPVSKSTWYKGVNAGRFPKPVRALGTTMAFYDAEDIEALGRSLLSPQAAE